MGTKKKKITAKTKKIFTIERAIFVIIIVAIAGFAYKQRIDLKQCYSAFLSCYEFLKQLPQGRAF